MRVAVFGYQSWGHRTLSAVINAGHEVVLVVTHPASDHPYEQMWADSVEEHASEHGLPVCVTERAGQDVIEALRDAAPDLLRNPRLARPRAFRARLARSLRRNPLPSHHASRGRNRDGLRIARCRRASTGDCSGTCASRRQLGTDRHRILWT